MKQEDYDDGIDSVIETHFVLAGMENIFKYEAHSKIEKAIYNNLKMISVHAGEKRIGLGEFQGRSNLLALCQYEFMLKKCMTFVESPIMKMLLEKVINKIKSTRELYGCPSFKEKDEIVMVEVKQGKYLKLIRPEELKRWGGEFRRLLPVLPDLEFRKIEDNCFLNYNGNEREAVNFVMKDD